MKIRCKNCFLASTGFGLLIFAFTFLSSNSLIFLTDAFLTRLTVTSETTVLQSFKAIRTLQAQYASKHSGRFAANFDELIKTVSLDEKFSGESPIVDGYVYRMTVQEPSATQPAFYSITADPPVSEVIKITGTYHFYFDSTLGIIKATEEHRQATANDPSI